MKKNLLLLSLLLVCFSMGGSRATVVNPGDEATASAACQSTATQIATLKSYVKALKAQVASIESQIQQIYGEHYATGEPLNKVEINALKMAKRHLERLIAAAEAKIAELEQKLNDCFNPPADNFWRQSIKSSDKYSSPPDLSPKKRKSILEAIRKYPQSGDEYKLENQPRLK